ncbi:hypothetical protein PSEUBRA_003018 [Kalmanozyma brasiliensis GHG001]|uniref:Uncharacterized protein n=1 Tax=Kalmanozyma brasiliensis (strain GHG001) TaxID=1365824 RepID=V5EWW3_KALBG|nr:uncharacterized protein PSEUBRA_003018 [Kalmanozyma brasiliensis GHG001]EST07893.1 hypothetical protein PSEUBRA_003018 [Kalmanozyma brasiliensis GHG001]
MEFLTGSLPEKGPFGSFCLSHSSFGRHNHLYQLSPEQPAICGLVAPLDIECSRVMADGGSQDGRPRALTIAPSTQATASFLTTLDRIRTTLARTSHDEKLLRDDAWPAILKRVHAALDTGKPITGAGPNRGLPMEIVSQTLKASWHVDGTWPIGPNAMQLLEEHSVEKARAEKGPEAKQDPTSEDVAQAYRRRGVVVDEAKVVVDDW